MFPISSQALGVLSNEEFEKFCLEQRDLRIERTESGEIIIMSPTYSESGFLNSEINRQLGNWNHQHRKGYVYDSSTGFRLKGKAVRSPDASWLSLERYSNLSPEEKRGFMRVCPEFVIELRSDSDTIPDLKAKMESYLKNGALLGWLIDPETETVWIFRADGSRDEVQGFDQKLSGESLLPGFELDLGELRGHGS
jgi:Uma2 family endonuclease